MPLTPDHLPLLGELRDHERILASHIMDHIRNGQSMDVIYHGGSHPGTPRHILPTFLFTTPTDTAIPNHPHAPIYLLAYCLTRQATRVFRLDRVGGMNTV